MHIGHIATSILTCCHSFFRALEEIEAQNTLQMTFHVLKDLLQGPGKETILQLTFHVLKNLFQCPGRAIRQRTFSLPQIAFSEPWKKLCK